MGIILDEAGNAVLDEAFGRIYDEAGPPAPGPQVSPAWLAARAGIPGDVAATAYAQQIAQFLTLHGVTPVYAGNQLITPSGLVGYGYGGITSTSLGVSDVDQPFTMPGGHTVTGRVTVPLIPQGNGADVTVSLCADSGGSPGTVLASTVIPREHLTQLAVSGAALATAQGSMLLLNDMTTVAWASPVSGSGTPALAGIAQSGNYAIQAGGQVAGSYIANVYTTGWQGGTSPGTVLPQPPLPAVSDFGTLIATGDTLLYAGGTSPNVTTLTANVWTAGWAPASGQVQAWTAGTSLPVATYGGGGGFDPATDTVYIAGGAITSGGTPTTAVWRARIVNGQLGSWLACPPLPAARLYPVAGVASGWMIVAGGEDASFTKRTEAWAAKIGSDGSLGSWTAIGSLPAALSGQDGGNATVVSGGLIIVGGFGASAPVNLFQSLAVSADGPGQWSQQALDPAFFASTATVNCPASAFPSGSGQWQVITVGPPAGQYSSGVMQSVPSVSVPLPATGLTGGGTYHILLHQQGGTSADYVTVAAMPGAQASSAQTRPATGGSWTAMPGHLYSVPAFVYDNTPGGPVRHLWEDSGARFTTLVYGSATGQLLGMLEATAFPSGSPRPMLAAVTQVQYGSTGEPSGLVQPA